MITFAGYQIDVEFTVQSTESINIEFHTKHFHFTDEVPFLLFQENK